MGKSFENDLGAVCIKKISSPGWRERLNNCSLASHGAMGKSASFRTRELQNQDKGCEICSDSFLIKSFARQIVLTFSFPI